jgi:tripartite-type tricarboxylate transporter receptor subunit TctC
MMFNPGRVIWSIVLSVTMASGVPVPSHAQYPSRVIQIIASVPPGGNVDLLARAIAPSMSEMLGQPVIVVNKTGASRNLGAEFVAKAAPDGYTLLLTGSFIAIGASFYKNLNYDVRRDFTEIARLVSSPNLIVVSGTSPFKSVAELVAFARANPGKLNFASRRARHRNQSVVWGRRSGWAARHNHRAPAAGHRRGREKFRVREDDHHDGDGPGLPDQRRVYRILQQ